MESTSPFSASTALPLEKMIKHVSSQTGNELIFLDPHTTQTFVDTEENGTVDDQTFHCLQSPQRMNILNLDPSVALGFFCKEEKDFDSWCSLVQKEILKENLRMFELVQKHPSHWPPFVPPAKPEVTTTGAAWEKGVWFSFPFLGPRCMRCLPCSTLDQAKS
ncbi:hypothetical protein GH733_019329 [Mirounga leonina]|nr:hypothetical protein GH733_019329 [Mirounga leonina]